MVELIGLATITALCWLLTYSMETESNSEKRRCSTEEKGTRSETRRAA